LSDTKEHLSGYVPRGQALSDNQRAKTDKLQCLLALYVAENNVKNHLKALPKAIVGIISGRNRPGYQIHDINPYERKEVTFE
jgi:hypothetical protein